MSQVQTLATLTVGEHSVQLVSLDDKTFVVTRSSSDVSERYSSQDAAMKKFVFNAQRLLGYVNAQAHGASPKKLP